MDERDEHESETESFADPVTERVRIIGAEPAGTPPAPKAPSTASGSQAGAAAYPDDAAVRSSVLDEGYRGFTDGDSDDEIDPWASADTRDLDQQRTAPSWLDDGDDLADEPPVSTDLPHWTDPPTGAGIVVGHGRCRPGMARTPSRMGRECLRPVVAGGQDHARRCSRRGAPGGAPALGVR